MNKRSLTLLEMLIALVLVLALGALIVPSMVNSLEERTFESAADVTNEQLMLARAHAQATGTPVEVTYSADKSQVQARLFLPLLPRFQFGQDFDSAILSPAAVQDSQSTIQESAEGLIDEAWACRELGRRVRIVSHLPEFLGENESADGDGPSSPAEKVQTIEDLGRRAQDVRLAVFMPDGSALLGDPVWLNDDKGRCGQFTVNPWSGLPIFQRLADLGSTPAQPDESQDRSTAAADEQSEKAPSADRHRSGATKTAAHAKSSSAAPAHDDEEVPAREDD